MGATGNASAPHADAALRVAWLRDLRLRGNENIRMRRKMRRPSMFAFPPMSSARKRTAANTIVAGLFYAGAAFGPAQGQGASRQDGSIPNFCNYSPYPLDHAAVRSGAGASRASWMAASALLPARRPVATMEQRSA